MIRLTAALLGLVLAAPAFAAEDAMRPGSEPATSWWEAHAACSAVAFASAVTDKAQEAANAKLHKEHYSLALARLAKDRALSVDKAEAVLRPVAEAGVEVWKAQLDGVPEPDAALAKKALARALKECDAAKTAYLKEFPDESKTLQALSQ